MATATLAREYRPLHRAAMWLPLLGSSLAVVLLAWDLPPWQFMWLLAVAQFVGFKWLSLSEFAARTGKPPGSRALGYLLLWPGMDADAFFDPSASVNRPPLYQWLFAVGKIAGGSILIFAVAPRYLESTPLLGGWIGMIGIAFVMHFGLLHLLALAWRTAGVNVTPIMQAPIVSTSLSEFWGKRWNLAFRDLVHRFVFRPGIAKWGVAGATMAVFLVSGLIHDFVISLPAGAGFGLPTLYFLLQGAMLLFERSRLGKRWGLRGGLAGRLLVLLVMVAPLGLLFPPPFVTRVVVPMLEVITQV